MKQTKFSFMPTIVAISVALCAALSSFATEYFVSPGGKGDGSSWESPLGTIEAALVKSDVTVVNLDVGTHEISLQKTLQIDRAITIKGRTGDPKDVTVRRPAADTVAKKNYSNFTLKHAGATIRDITVSDGFLTTGNGCNVYLNNGLVDHCIISEGNHGGQGGGAGVYMTGGRVTRSVVRNNKISTSSAYYHGGGVEATGGQVDNCLIVGNVAYQGAGVYVNGKDVKVWNCTIVGNNGSEYPGVYRNSGSPQIYNCVIADNTTTAYKPDLTKICNYTAGMKGCLTRTPVNADCTCGIFVFKDAANGDYRLIVGSDGIDSAKAQDVGWTATDLDLVGGSRVVNSIADAGCYEWNAADAGVEVLAGASALSGAVPAAASFSAHVSGLAGTVSCLWDFGDGSTSTEENPSHQFENAGVYTVTLTVSAGGQDYPAANVLKFAACGSVIEVDGSALTLAQAVDIVTDGGEIVIKKAGSPYTLTGEVLVARPMTIRGETGNPADVVLTRDTAGAKFRLVHIDNPNALLASLTIENGCLSGTANGANVLIDSQGGTVSNCVIRGGNANGSNRYGAGISANGANAWVKRCVITNNTGYVRGTSYCGGSGAHLTGGATIENSLVAHNSGAWGAIAAQNASRVFNCTIVDNSSLKGGAGVHFLWSGASRVYNTIIAYNSGETDQLSVFNTDYGKNEYFFNCTADKVDMSAVNGNVYGTPDFTDRAEDDYMTSKISCNVGRGSNDVTKYAEDAIDLAGNPRLGEEGKLDIGCYQWTLSGLEVSFAQDKALGILPVTVAFTPNVEGAAGDYVCQWDLDGDGIYETESQNDATVSKTYVEAATYVVSMRVVYNQQEFPAPSTKRVRAYPGAVEVSDELDVHTAIASVGPGSVVTLPPDDYVLTNRIDITEGITLRGKTGDPKDVRISRANGQLLRIDNKDSFVSGITFENTTFYAYGQADPGMVQIAANGGTVSNCVVRNCTSVGNGGVIFYESGADALVTHCSFTDNTTDMGVLAGYAGGAVVMAHGGATVSHSLVARNKTCGTVNDNPDFGHGGIILFGGSKVVHCTVADNEGDKSAGMFCNDDKCRVYDTVITGGKVREGYNPSHGYRSTMYYANCFCDTEVLNTKGLSGDPGYFSAAAGMYRPRSASPLVDQCGGSCALPKVDLRGKPRVFGKAADLGCYECQNFGLMLMVK